MATHVATCSIYQDGQENNGLITKIWGGAGWTFCHSVAFGYPIHPTDEQKVTYKNHFKSIGDILPCKYCRDSYQKFIAEGDTRLTDAVMESRNSLTRWFFDIHNAVNNKLGVDYGITYEEHVAKYESFRAKCGGGNAVGCVTPLDYKAYSYKRLNQKDCPIVPDEMIGPFVRLARIRGMNEFQFCFYDKFKKLKMAIPQRKKLDMWTERNYFCDKQIRHMRESGIPSIEAKGQWQGTPTLEELKLLLHFSSTLSFKEIKECTIHLLTNRYYLSAITSIYE